MMIKKKLYVVLFTLFSFTLLTGFGLKDLTDKIKPNTDKCEKSSNKSRCKREERLKSAAKVVAIGVAAKLLYDLVVEYTSIGVKGDHEIVEVYLNKNKTLPPNPKVLTYTANMSPTNLVKVGKKVTVKSYVEVVPSKKSRKVKIEEKIDIYDNEDTKKTIKSLVKTVNDEQQKAGAYENQFSFTLPKGMPQGVYPIKTAILVDGKAHPAANNDMQVVLRVNHDHSYQLAYANVER